MPKTAAVLFVHNEADNIGWWLSHHATIGFSTLIVCDDHSTDGTWTLLSNAASFYDIRLQRSDKTIPDRLERQTAFQKAVFEHGRTEFDWMMILAADEYLHLEQASSLEEFLGSANGQPIPVNWCLFGSNGHETPSPFAPSQAFTHHALLETADHRVTRTLLPAERLESALPDPFGRISSHPDWSQARVLHYAAGDRQSFFQRGSSETPEDAWKHFDRNDALETGPQRWLPETRRIAAALVQSGLTDLYWRLRQTVVHHDENTLEKLGLSASALSTEDDSTFPDFQFYAFSETQPFVLDLHTEQLIALPASDLDPTRHVRMILAVEASSVSPYPAFLFPERPCQAPCLNITGSPSLLAAVPLRFRPEDQSMASAITGQSVDFEIPDPTLLPQEATSELYARLTALMVLSQGGHTLEALLRGIERLPAPDATALGCAIAMLSPTEAEQLAVTFPGLVPLSVRPVSP